MTYEPNSTDTQHLDPHGMDTEDPIRGYVLSWLPDHYFEECDGDIGQDEDEASYRCRIGIIVYWHISQICSVITRGRVLNGEFYAHRSQKLSLFAFAYRPFLDDCSPIYGATSLLANGTSEI